MTDIGTEILDPRPYNDQPFLVFPGALPFKIAFGNLEPTLRAFVYQRTNLFGDKVPLELAGLTITFNLYSTHGELVASGIALVSDVDVSEIEYSWKDFDLVSRGNYIGEFVFTDINDKTFTLPTPENRLEVICY